MKPSVLNPEQAMMNLSDGNYFCINGPLWGESSKLPVSLMDFPYRNVLIFLVSLNKLLNKQ